jgi:cell division protein FtsQ
MPREKNVPINLRSWRLWRGVAFWLAIGISTAWAGRKVSGFVHDDPRFIVAGTFAETEDTPDFLVQGLHFTSREKVVRVFADDFGKSVFSIPIDERRRRLLAVDWIDDATVARILPNRLVVRVRERVPIAFVRVARDPRHLRLARLALIDADGVILDPPRKGSFSFPIVSGVYESQTEAERRDRVLRMQRLMHDLGTISKDVSEVDVSSPDLKMTAQVSGRALELWIGDRNFSKRMHNFLNYYAEISKRSASSTTFDLRLDDRITAKE